MVAGEHQLDAFLIQFSYISHTILILINGFSPNWELEAGSWKPDRVVLLMLFKADAKEDPACAQKKQDYLENLSKTAFFCPALKFHWFS